MSNKTITLDTKTDKRQAITHVLHNLLTENDGEMAFNEAKRQTLEQLHKIDGCGIDDIDENDFDNITNTFDDITTGTDQWGQKSVTHVDTVDAYPEWLPEENINDSNNLGVSDNEFDINSLNTDTNTSDDFSELSCLTDHQPGALKDAGFETFRDLYEASTDELMNVPGIGRAVANELQDQANEHIDPAEEIARKAYEREAENNTEQTKGLNQIAESHIVSDVKIPAANARDPEKYAGTNLQYKALGYLPVLERPTISINILDYTVKNSSTINAFIQRMKPLIKYDEQFERFKQDIESEFDSIDELSETISKAKASSHANAEKLIEEITQQVGVTKELLQDGIEKYESESTTSHSIQELSNAIDLEFENKVPAKARLRLVYAMRRELKVDGKVSSMLDDQTINDLQAASEAPIELDHPFIEELSNFTSYKTREKQTGETAIASVAKKLAKEKSPDLIGHAGVGKDTLLRVLAAATNRPIIVVNMDESMISQDLLGMYKVNDSGAVEFQDGVVPHCAKYGYMLVVSELNAAAPEILSAFNQMLEDNGKVHIKEKDEIIEPSAKFKFAATRNPATQDYAGMKEMNGALERRISSIWIPYLDVDEEAALICDKKNATRKVISRKDAKSLAWMAEEFREQADTGSDVPRITTTHLFHIVDEYDGPGDLLGAAEVILEHDIKKSRDTEFCRNTMQDYLK